MYSSRPNTAQLANTQPHSRQEVSMPATLLHIDRDQLAAPRVVEGAFKRVWAERATFETPEALETFLHEEVHDCAVRERKRLATLHRFEAGAHVHATPHRTSLPTVDEAWNHLA